MKWSTPTILFVFLIMKIYTKTGDKGKTSLIGGKRVYKFDEQVDAYGTIDELISYIGLIRSYFVEGSCVGKWKDRKNTLIYPYNNLLNIQDKLMTCASLVAKDVNSEVELERIDIDKELLFLESEIDKMDEALPKLDSFILPGGYKVSAHCHVSRTICRKAERKVIKVSFEPTMGEDVGNLHNTDVIKYLNRLSDYLFTLARFLNYNETKWLRKK